MPAMFSYPHRQKSGQITCYHNRTYHVLTTHCVLRSCQQVDSALGFVAARSEFLLYRKWHCERIRLPPYDGVKNPAGTLIMVLANGRRLLHAMPVIQKNESRLLRRET